MVAQLALRPAVVAVEDNRPLVAARDRLAVRVGVNKAVEVIVM